MARSPAAGWLLASATLLAFPSAGQAQEDRPEVTELRFRGQVNFRERTLRSAIVTRETSCKSVVLEPFCWAGADFAVDRHFLNPREFARDVARIKVFYYQRGYREATVDTTLVVEGEGPSATARVTFTVTEGRPVLVDSLAFLGVDEAEAAGLLDGLPIAVGSPLDATRLDATRDSIVSRLKNQGYAHADVLRNYFIPSDEPYSAEVTFDAFPGRRGRIGPVVVDGAQRVSESVVRRMLPFREGDLYSEEVLFEGQRRLFNLEIFRHADLQQDLQHDPDTVIPIRVQVNEGDVHRVRTGFGWSTADCLNTEARWSSRNFLGGARRLQIRGRLSNILAQDLNSSACGQAGSGVYGRMNWLLSADFTQPWFFSPRNSLALGIFAERQSLPEVFVRRGVGVSGALGRSLGRGTSLTLAYRPQLARLDAAEIFFCTSFLVCDPQDIGTLEGTNWLSPVGLTFTRDRTDRAINPTRGYTWLADFEAASDVTGSDFRYERVIAEATGFTSPTRGWVLALRLRGGWMNPRSFADGDVTSADVAHPQKRFFAGGANSVRGFAQNQLGPRVLTVGVEQLLVPDEEGSQPLCTPEELRDLTCDASGLPEGRFDNPRPTGGSRVLEGSLEARFGVGETLQGALYVDFGQVWAEDDAIQLDDVEFTPGLGVRYQTPIGPLRVDLAYRFSPAERLRVVTSQIQACEPDECAASPDRVSRVVDGEVRSLDYLRLDELAPLTPRVLFGDSGTFDFSRFQLHVSIGQAF